MKVINAKANLVRYNHQKELLLESLEKDKNTKYFYWVLDCEYLKYFTYINRFSKYYTYI